MAKYNELVWVRSKTLLPHVKHLFILPAVLVSVKYGSKIGLGFSITMVAVLTGINLLWGIYPEHFDYDLVLFSMIILVSWLVGSMAQTEEQIRRQLTEMATKDGLTNVYNHRAFHGKMDTELAKTRQGLLGLLMLDIDYFKYYNDIYGHQKGDQVLKELAGLLSQVVQEPDFVARYGGEEFAIVLTDATQERAARLAVRLRVMVENHPFYGVETQPQGKLTVSIGVAFYPLMATTKEELLDKADEALYKAKFVSKNKVEIYFSVFDELARTVKDSEKELLNSVRTLITVVNAKDRYTFGHSERVADLAVLLGNQLGLEEKEISMLRYGALLHDIGKIEIAREILNKQSQLTEKEWAILKQHPTWGAQIIKPISSLKEAVPMVLYHHENFNGTGYPTGLEGDDIPLGARILRIADSFDAMIINRPYRKGRTKHEAVAEVKKLAGTRYDPNLTAIFAEAVLAETDLLA